MPEHGLSDREGLVHDRRRQVAEAEHPVPAVVVEHGTLGGDDPRAAGRQRSERKPLENKGLERVPCHVGQVYEVASPHDVPIIGQGGIGSAIDALEFLIAGDVIRTVIVSHTGIYGHCPTNRNLPDDLMQDIADAGLS